MVDEECIELVDGIIYRIKTRNEFSSREERLIEINNYFGYEKDGKYCVVGD